MHKPLPMSRMREGVMGYSAESLPSKPVRMDSPAIDVMTDLRQIPVVTVPASERIADATRLMMARRIRLLLVVDEIGVIEGVISARDTMGAKPLKLLQERRGARFEDLIVSDLMTPRHAIDVLDMETVLAAEVGSILATLEAHSRQHALVLETDELLGLSVVRGIFSATQIARQLGVTMPTFQVAQTFAEIASALEK